jgi:hypothetical protein
MNERGRGNRDAVHRAELTQLESEGRICLSR